MRGYWKLVTNEVDDGFGETNDIDREYICKCILAGCTEGELIHDDPEPEIDDTVKYCPDCETPNQFGEVCPACQRDRDNDAIENR